MGVVAEAMTALVLCAEAQRKFGGDSVAEMVRNRDGFIMALGETPSAVPVRTSEKVASWVRSAAPMNPCISSA